MSKQSLVQLNTASPEIVRILTNFTEGERNVRFYQFRNNHWYPFGDGIKQNRHFHWHSCTEFGATVAPEGKTNAILVLHKEEVMLEGGQIFEIAPRTLHFLQAVDGTVLINWHDGPAMALPENTLRAQKR